MGFIFIIYRNQITDNPNPKTDQTTSKNTLSSTFFINSYKKTQTIDFTRFYLLYFYNTLIIFFNSTNLFLIDNHYHLSQQSSIYTYSYLTQQKNNSGIPLESTGRGLGGDNMTQMTSDLSKQIKLNTSRFCEYSISLIYIIDFI